MNVPTAMSLLDIQNYSDREILACVFTRLVAQGGFGMTDDTCRYHGAND